MIIEDRLKRDADLREYVEKNNPEPSRKKLGEVVLAMKPRGGIVVKGMEAIAQAISNGKKTINAMVQTNEPYLMSVAGETVGFPERQIKVEIERFGKEVDAALDRTMPVNQIPELLSFAPPLLIRLGAIEDSIWMPQAVIRKAEEKPYSKASKAHDIDGEVLKQLPSAINNPVMVFDSIQGENALVVLTDLKNRKGLPVAVVLRYDAVIGHEIANLVPTVTDKDGNRFLTTWTDKGKARYYSKEKGPAFLELIGLQSSEVEEKILATPNVLTEADFVNGNDALRKVRTPEAYNELKALQQADDFTEIVPKIKTSVDGNTIALESSEAAEAVRTLLAFAFDTKREAQPLLEGLFLEPKDVENLLEAADAFAEATEENGVDPEPMNELVRNIAAASKENGTIKLHVFDDTLTHEEIHEGSYLGADGKRFEARYANSKELKADPVFKRFHQALNKIQGKTSHGNIGHVRI